MRTSAPLVVVMSIVIGGLFVMRFAVARRDAGMQPAPGSIAFEALVEAGLKVDERIDEGEVGRLVSAGLVHTGDLHLVINVVGLLLTGIFWWRVSPARERRWARAWVLPALLITTSSAGFLLSYLVRAGPSGGASAAVYGMLAAVAGATWVQRRELPERMRWTAPVALTALSLAAVLILLGRPGVDHAAHLGGWAFGLPAGAAAQHRAGRIALAGLALALAGLAFVQ